MEYDAMDVSFLSSVPETTEESMSDNSEPSTPKSVASPPFSPVSSSPSIQHSGDETQPEDNEVVLDNCPVQKACGSLDCTASVDALSTQQNGVPSSQQSSGENQDKVPSSQQSRGESQCGCVAEMDPATTETTEMVTGTKIVIDNIDKNITPRLMTSEKQTKSLHYVQMYAVRDRTDTNQLSDDAPVNSPSLTAEEVSKTILPSPEDNEAIAEYFSTLVSRVLVTHFPFFKMTFDDVVQWNVPHKFSEEMARKSEVVSTCV